MIAPKPEGLQAPERGNRNRWKDEEEAFRIVTDYVLDCRSRGVTASQDDYRGWAKGTATDPQRRATSRQVVYEAECVILA